MKTEDQKPKTEIPGPRISLVSAFKDRKGRGSRQKPCEQRGYWSRRTTSCAVLLELRFGLAFNARGSGLPRAKKQNWRYRRSRASY